MEKLIIEDLFAENSAIAEWLQLHFVSVEQIAAGSQTPLGAAATWTPSLKSAFGILSSSCYPMFLVWNRDAVQSCSSNSNSSNSNSSKRILLYNNLYLALLQETQSRIPLGNANTRWMESWRQLQADVEQVLSTGQTLQRQQKLSDREGQRSLCSWSYSAIWDETSQIRGMFATGCPVLLDAGTVTPAIADRLQYQHELQLPQQTAETQVGGSSLQQTEAALRKSEARFEAFMRHSPTSAWIADQQGCLLYLSPTYFQMFQLPRQDAVGKPIHDIYTEEFAQQFLENNRRVFETGQVIETVETAPRPDGSIGSFLVYKFPIIQASEETLLGGVAIDITERERAEEELRQSEERYRYLAELIPQLVWTANPEGVLIDINQRWSSFTGLTLAQARTQGWQAVVHPDDIPALSQSWGEAQQEGVYYQAEGRMRRADGVYRWHLHQAIPLKNDRGQLIKWFGTATDIEDQKQLEQQRTHLLQQEQTAREQAEQANRIKDEFLAVLSHELRSPLNPILGWARLLQTRQFDAAGTKRALETIERNAKLQTQLIDDLLDVSRILRGKMLLNVCEIDLLPVIDAAIETVHLSAEAKNITIHKTIVGEFGLILGDAGRLQQIIWNLLSNAVKFTPASGQIFIQLEQVNGNAQIQIRDTGKGIVPEFLPYVFEYFRQEDGTTTRKFGGLGLGLAIVRYLTELHGGTVHAKSPGAGMGATFTVLLPTVRGGEKLEQAEVCRTEAIPTLLKDVRILLVDDEIDMRELTSTILEQTGAVTRAVASAVEALDALDEFKPAILISDIGMPEMDGYELMRQVRSLPAEGGRIPAIALTAYAGEIDQQQALAAGFQRHLAKPIEPEALIRAIAMLVKS